MLGSPNFVLYLHDGSTTTNNQVKLESSMITAAFEEIFSNNQEDYVLTDMIAGL